MKRKRVAAVDELSCRLQLSRPMGAEHLASVIVLLLTAQFKQDANELVANRDDGLLFLQRIILTRCEIQV